MLVKIFQLNLTCKFAEGMWTSRESNKAMIIFFFAQKLLTGLLSARVRHKSRRNSARWLRNIGERWFRMVFTCLSPKFQNVIFYRLLPKNLASVVIENKLLGGRREHGYWYATKRFRRVLPPFCAIIPIGALSGQTCCFCMERTHWKIPQFIISEHKIWTQRPLIN